MPPRTALRRPLRAVAVLVLLIAVVLGGTLWLAGREPLLRWLAGQAVEASGGRVVLEGVRGSLFGPLRVSRLVYEDRKLRIEARGIDLDWLSWHLLGRRHVTITRLSMDSLHIASKTTEPPTLPQNLRLPFTLALARGSIGALTYSSGGGRLEFGKLAFGLRGDADGYHFDVPAAESPWGRMRGTAQLAAAPPFALSGKLALEGGQQPPFAAEAALSGKLSEIAIAATGGSGRIEASANGVLTLFEKTPWKRAALSARHGDPAQWRKGLPQGDFTVAVSLEAQPGGKLRGTIEASNAMPGRLDQERWPLRRLAAAIDGDLAALRLHGIELDLGAAGRFTGSGSGSQRAVALDLDTRNFDLRGMHGRLKSTRLAGAIRLGLEGAAQTLRVDLSQQGYRMRLEAVHRDNAVEVKTASVVAAGGELGFSGTLALAGSRDFRAQGALRRFDPARFGDFPIAVVNAKFSASGRLDPKAQALLRITFADSRYRGQPLSGQAELNVSARRIWGSDIALALGANRLNAHGAFGTAGDRLDWRIAAADLAVIGPDFGGRGIASGTLEGTPGAPSGTFSANAEQLRWSGQRLASLNAKGRLERGLDGTLALNAELRGYRSNGIAFERASVTASGRRTSHTLTIAAAGADFDARAELAGGWREKAGWSGTLRTLENRGRHALTLHAPAPLALAPGRFSLSAAALRYAGGSIDMHALSLDVGRWSSRGEMRGISAAHLYALAGTPGGAETSLKLGGKWSVAAAERVDGSMELWREQGDVVMPADPKTPLGLTRLLLRVTAADSRVSGRLEVAGTTLGHLMADVGSTLTRRDGNWGLAGDTPLAVTLDASMPSIAWTAPLLGRGLALDGSLTAQLSGGGTWREPRFNGAISGERLQFSLPAQGVHFSDGSLKAELHDDTLLLKQLTLRGGQGRLSGTGSASLKNGAPVLQLALGADKLEVLARPDRHLVLSGTADVAVQEKRVRVTGKLKADEGLIELPKAGEPTLSDDVVVLGRPPKAEKKGLPRAAELNLDLDLGERFYLKGGGLDARLTGAVRLIGLEGRLAASGAIRVAQGTWAAYGKRLEIERGIVSFAGPIDDPALNIVALRKNQPVEAGVAIGGTALAPRITLTSNPVVPDSEKLSWLVLGHGMEGTSGAEFSVLQAAAGALLARGQSATLESRIAHAAGLDEFALSGRGGLESTVLTLGKRLSSRAYLSFEQGLTGAGNLVKINYALTPRLSVRAQSGTDSAVDLFYTFSLD
jgi:translocation and assembly module TamB